MAITVEAVYENGVLKPAEPLPFQERQKVRLTIDPAASWVQATAGIIGFKGDNEMLERLLTETEEPEPLP